MFFADHAVFEATVVTLSAGLAFAVSFFTSLVLSKASLSNLNEGAQQTHWIHDWGAKRLGGLCILLGLINGILLHIYLAQGTTSSLTAFTIVFSLMFILGFSEDISQNIKASLRFIFSLLISCSLVGIILWINMDRVQTLFSGNILLVVAGSFVLVAFVMAVVHGTNMIDGLNGLCSGWTLIALLTISTFNADGFTTHFDGPVWIVMASIAGFYVINFPFGRVFLGDSGAYLIGLICATLVLLTLTERQNWVFLPTYLSAIALPLLEVTWSFIRRCLTKQSHPFKPDQLHLHSLLFNYLRKTRFAGDLSKANYFASGILLIFAGVNFLLCFVEPENAALHSGRLIIIIALYFIAYRVLLRFKQRPAAL